MSERLEIFVHEEETCILKSEAINIFTSESGTVYLPDAGKDIMHIRVVFTEEGNFYVKSNDSPITTGRASSYGIKIETGTPGFDNQPQFVFLPKKGKWFIVSMGTFIFL